MWKIIDTGKASAANNMRLDSELLDALKPDDAPIIHFYDWQYKSATYGYFIKKDQLIDSQKAQEKGLDLARRPTGGGVIFHLFDLAFSVLIPASHPGYSSNTLENYAFVNRAVQRAVVELWAGGQAMELLPHEPLPQTPDCLHFCMAKPTIYDVMLAGRKVAGAAQRRRKNGFLHQGSIAIAPPDINYLTGLIKDPSVVEAMQTHTHALLPADYTDKDLAAMRHDIKRRLERSFCET